MNTMKKYAASITTLILIIGLSSGIANAGSSSGSSSTGGSTTHFTSNTPYGTTGYNTDANGNVTGSFSTNCGNCATGGGGTTGGGGGGNTNTTGGCTNTTGAFGGKNSVQGNCPPPGTPPPPPPPPVCTITADKTVIGLGQSKIHLSWKPVPTTNVSLQRQAVGMKLAEGAPTDNASQQASIILAGGGGTTVNKAATTQVVGKVLIAPPSTAESFDDTVNVALSGAGTNMTTVISRNGNVPDQQASIILAGGGGTTVNPGSVIKTPVSKDGGTITYNLSYNAAKKRNGGSAANLIEGATQASQQATALLAGGGGGTVAAPVTYTCSVVVKIVAKITECNDGIDNADPEDTLIDQQDPGCHTDGNPANAASYDPTITSETNTAIDLVAHITAPQKSNAQQPLQVSASGENLSGIFAPANTLVTGWRNTATVGTPSCGVGGSQCITANGHTYIRMGSLVQTYLPRALQFLSPQSFTPQSKGTYEVCAVADYYNVVAEGPAGEANNVACQTVQVLDGNGTNGPGTASSTITGPISFTAAPTRVKKGNTATLSWNTGGRTKCTIKGMNGQIINLTGAPSATTGVTTPITFETKYTLSCADDNTSADATVKLLPQYQEI